MSQQKSIIVWSSEQSRAQKNINKEVLQSEHTVCGWLLWPCHSLVFLQQASWKADANLCHCSENWCWKGSLLILSVVRETQRSWVLFTSDNLLWFRWCLFNLTWNRYCTKNGFPFPAKGKRKERMSCRCGFSVLPIEARPFSHTGALEQSSFSPLTKSRELLFCCTTQLSALSPSFPQSMAQHGTQPGVRPTYPAIHLPQSYFSCYNMTKTAQNIWVGQHNYSKIPEVYFLMKEMLPRCEVG